MRMRFVHFGPRIDSIHARSSVQVIPWVFLDILLCPSIFAGFAKHEDRRLVVERTVAFIVKKATNGHTT